MDRPVRVGDGAPDFQAAVLHGGEITEISLEQYRGSWIILLFYVGDFTIV